MQLIEKKKPISVTVLKTMSQNMYDNLVKAVVDVSKEIMVIDADMHADQEETLLASGSKQENIWGINLYPHRYKNDDWIEFDSMINIRPSWGNRSRSVDDKNIQQQIIKIVNELVSNED